MPNLEDQILKLETLARQCHADAAAETVQKFTLNGFPVDDSLKSALERMVQVAREIHRNPEIEFRRSPRGFYLTVFPLLAQALIQIFEDGAPQNLPPQVRRGHITRRLFGLPDDLDKIASGASSWGEISNQLANYVDGMIGASWENTGETELAQFYRQHPDAFMTLYRAGYEEFTGQTLPEE